MSGEIKNNYSPYVQLGSSAQILRAFPKIKRNMVCPFTSLKFKLCCGASGQNFCNKSMDQLNNHIKNLNNPNA